MRDDPRVTIPVVADPVVYRVYGVHRLLYIGKTTRLLERLGAHARHSCWWSEADRVEVIRFESEVAADEAERVAIQSENPPYNKNLRREALREIKRLLRSQGAATTRELMRAGGVGRTRLWQLMHADPAFVRLTEGSGRGRQTEWGLVD